MNATFEVTAEDTTAAIAAIKSGGHRSKTCPVAQALMRLGVSFDGPGNGVSASGWCTEAELHRNPKAIGRFVDAFDAGKNPPPQTFTVPASWLPEVRA